MKFYRGLWYYQGRAYSTLRAALGVAWQKGRQ